MVRGGTTEQLRRANLSRVLELLHEDGPHSRADLTRLVGSSRSTMAGVVTELEELGLVAESMPELTGGAGRPSGVVSVNPDVVAVTVNPEVDAVHVGLVGLGGRVIKHARIEVPDTDVTTVVSLAAATIRGMLSDDPPRYRVLGVGLAVPGQVRISDGVVRQATHLGWSEVPLTDLITHATGLPAWAANAATLAMRAESRLGAGKGVADLVYLIGGASGVGGGAVVGGHLLTGSAGYAGEFGHTVVTPGGTPCHCGGRGCLEAEVDQATLLAAVGLGSADAGRLGERLKASGDPEVVALVADRSARLAVAVRNALNVFNPQAIVLSGHLAALHEASELDLIAEGVASSREAVEIRSAALGDEQLMIGAAELVWSELLADPAGLLAR
ncbi:ROK family transcriptional regulator [Nocardioides nematodiphilus]|uniref:ROK family transcriptional regulator n=1 Tax=Nocardioides nematodiphilus TaxID=2849669 RepID=UPI001CD93320|nr:ROK family transcriptional regulator [Nocardioides nematodiphilus]MCA1983348.1 ROK family protein [Nocardioides nematodiphilus]